MGGGGLEINNCNLKQEQLFCKLYSNFLIDTELFIVKNKITKFSFHSLWKCFEIVADDLPDPDPRIWILFTDPDRILL